jgi:hypothetical protein
MDEAVDRVLEESRPAGTYGDHAIFDKSYLKSEVRRAFEDGGEAPNAGRRGLREGNLQHTTTHGRFPAHERVPFTGRCAVLHLEMEFYDKYFDRDLYHRQAEHDAMWDH